jgi:hypothetical protein
MVEARRQWMEVPCEDFERVGPAALARPGERGRVPRGRRGTFAGGVGQEATRDVSCFFIEGGKLIFLRRADVPEGTVVHHGPVRGGQVVDGQIRWEAT